MAASESILKVVIPFDSGLVAADYCFSEGMLQGGANHLPRYVENM